MKAALPVVIIGGGVAGCAAAVAAAESGANTILIEAARMLGGVAVQGEHRTLCGLSLIDAATPDLLEPELVARWIGEISTGPAFRQGRVWLWPTDAVTLQKSLLRRVQQSGVDLRRGRRIQACDRTAEGMWTVHLDDGQKITARELIDASGAGVVAGLLGLSRQSAGQWPAHRSVLSVPNLTLGTAARVAALRVAQLASGSSAAIALVPLDMANGRWQLSLDVMRDSQLIAVAKTVERIAQALDGTVLAMSVTLAQRDDGRPASSLDLDELFATRERGVCWAAWPREEHGPDGVEWQWPATDRYGIPERAAHIVGAPDNLWCIGKGAAVTTSAAAALRVTGTCLAMGAAVGIRAALNDPSDHAH
jgi:2-polyprenyl-6-methoxyphenol hydroxylase-like FAD-dependent oxidoreductase